MRQGSQFTLLCLVSGLSVWFGAQRGAPRLVGQHVWGLTRRFSRVPQIDAGRVVSLIDTRFLHVGAIDGPRLLLLVIGAGFLPSSLGAMAITSELIAKPLVS